MFRAVRFFKIASSKHCLVFRWPRKTETCRWFIIPLYTVVFSYCRVVEVHIVRNGINYWTEHDNNYGHNFL